MAKTSQYDFLLATTPDESAAHPYDFDPDDDPAADGGGEAFRLAATMAREAFRLAADVALADAVNGGILLARMAGLSLAEIGARLGMSKQAVHKRVMAMARRWPALGEVITGATAPLDEEAAGRQSFIDTYRKLEKIRQEATRWMSKPN